MIVSTRIGVTDTVTGEILLPVSGSTNVLTRSDLAGLHKPRRRASVQYRTTRRAKMLHPAVSDLLLAVCSLSSAVIALALAA